MIGYNNQVYNIGSAGTLKNIKISDKTIPTSGLNEVYCPDYVQDASVNVVKYSALFPWWSTDGIDSDISPTAAFDSETYLNANVDNTVNGQIDGMSAVKHWIYSAYNPANNTFNFDYSYPKVTQVSVSSSSYYEAQTTSRYGRTEFSIKDTVSNVIITGAYTSPASMRSKVVLSGSGKLTSSVLNYIGVVKFTSLSGILTQDLGNCGKIDAIQKYLSAKDLTLSNVGSKILVLDMSPGKVSVSYASLFDKIDVIEFAELPMLTYAPTDLTIAINIPSVINIHSIVDKTKNLVPKNGLKLTLADDNQTTKINIDGNLTNLDVDSAIIKSNTLPLSIDLTLVSKNAGKTITSSVPTSITYSNTDTTTCKGLTINLLNTTSPGTNVTNSVSFACTTAMANTNNNEIQFPTSGTNNLSVKSGMVNGLNVNVSGQYKNLNSLTITDSISAATTFDLVNIGTAIKTVNLSLGSTGTNSISISSLPSGANINVGTATAAEVACTGVYKGTGTLNYNILGINPDADTAHAITTDGVSTLNISLNQGAEKDKSNTITVGDSGTTTKALSILKIGGTATTNTAAVTTTLKFDTTAANVPSALTTIDASDANIGIITTTLPTSVTSVKTSKVGGDSITTGAGTTDKGLAITIPTQQAQSPRAQVTIKDNKTTTGIITISGYDVESAATTGKDTFKLSIGADAAKKFHGISRLGKVSGTDTIVVTTTTDPTNVISVADCGATIAITFATGNNIIKCAQGIPSGYGAFTNAKLKVAAEGFSLPVVYKTSDNTIHISLLHYGVSATDAASPDSWTEVDVFSGLTDTDMDALISTLSWVA